jgi:hypothetical protein
MLKNKFSLATFAVGSILTLFGPAVASARDRDDNHRQGNDSRYDSRYDSHDRDRDNDRGIREQQERERLEHRRNPVSFYNNRYNNSSPRIVVNGYRNSNGYYDNAGCWHQY